MSALADAIAARWPGVRVDDVAVTTALAARELAATAPVATDVALAIALGTGDPGALVVFERELVPEIRGAIARLDERGDLVDEALQRVREKLLVGGGTPRIVEYRGRGALAAWLQVIAIREALMVLRGTRRESPRLDEPMLAIVESDPTLAFTKRAYRDELADVFRDALAKLETRERTLLRLTFVDGVGTERLAATYGVHRVTMFRWLASARANLLELLRAGVVAKIGIAEGEVDSLIRAVASSLDVSW
jgi:RNA polymerase sigma-70 factor (ECF subfamily)